MENVYISQHRSDQRPTGLLLKCILHHHYRWLQGIWAAGAVHLLVADLWSQPVTASSSQFRPVPVSHGWLHPGRGPSS